MRVRRARRGEEDDGVSLATIRIGGVHTTPIEAKGVVSYVHNATSTGLEEGVWRRRYASRMAFDPELAAKVVAASYNQGGAYIRRVAMPARSKVLVDLNGRVREVICE